MKDFNSADILFLENTSFFKDFTSQIEKLKSKFLEIQLEENYSNNEEYNKFYQNLKKEDRSLLLNIPANIDITSLGLRNQDAVFLTCERNSNNMTHILNYCTGENIRICLRVSKEEDLGPAFRWWNEYPNILIILRMEKLNFQKAYNFFKEKALYLDLPLCLSQKYHLQTSLKALFDVKAFLDASGYYPADPNIFLKSYKKKESTCEKCSLNKKCFGCLRENTSIDKELISSKDSIKEMDIYPTIVSRVKNLKPVDCKVIRFDPEDWENSGMAGVSAINQMQKTRLEKKFSGANFYYIWDIQKSFYFNRPLTKENLFKRDPRGLMSLNWQFIGIDNPEMLWKQRCDLLLPEHGFTITSQISFDKHWDNQSQKDLDVFTLSSLKDLILEAGASPEKITQKGNDLLYEGKKFCGKEWLFVPNYGYIENTVVTCEYKPEKKWFKKLYHHPGEYVITGITEEVPNCTKKYLILGLYKKLASFIRGF